MGNTSQMGAGGSSTVESMNFTVVEQKLSPYVESYNTYYENIQGIDTKVAESVQVSGGAIGGIVGQTLFTEWSENCVPLLNFKRYFEDIKTRISTIYNANAEAYNASMDQYAVDQNGEKTAGIVTPESDVYSVYGDGASSGGNVTEASTESGAVMAAEQETEVQTEAETEAVTEVATEASTEVQTEVPTEGTETQSAIDNAGNETTVM